MKCVICKLGETQPGTTVITLQRSERTLVFKGVPAEICENCGEYYLFDEIAKGIHRRAEESLERDVVVQSKRVALTEASSRWHQFLNFSTLAVSAVVLLAHVFGIGKLAYDVIAIQELADLGFKLIVLLIVLLFGVGVGVVSLKAFQNRLMVTFARFYVWAYIFIVCLTYLGIALSLYGRNYSWEIYLAFISVVLAELLAIYVVQVEINNRDIRYYSTPLFITCIAHIVLIVYAYVFASVRVSIYLAGDLIFFVGMTLVASAMLGDFGFATMLSKIRDESYNSVPAGLRNWLEGETSIGPWKASKTDQNPVVKGDKKVGEEKKA